METPVSLKIFNRVLTDEDNLHIFTIAKDTQFFLDLKENGSTGYLWTAPLYDPTVLLLNSDETYLENKTDVSNIGGSYMRRFSFTTKKEGVSSLILFYKRPFEVNKLPISTFSISIKVF